MFQQPTQQQNNVDPAAQQEQEDVAATENAEAPSSSFGTVSASALNVRSGPSSQTGKVGLLRKGASVTITATQGAWHQIAYNGNVAWVHGGHIELAAAAPTEHTVSSGETLWIIARDTLGDGNRWQEIAALNNIANPSRINVGDVLRLPGGAQAPTVDTNTNAGGGGGATSPDTNTGAAPADQQAAPAPAEHVVVSGDNLSKIAQRYLGSANRWREIAELNNITNPSAISIGQKLRLPSDATLEHSGANSPAGGGGGVTAGQVAADIANPEALATAVNAALGVVASSTASRAPDHVPVIMAQCARSGITITNQVAYLLATAEHESGFGNEKYSRSESLIEDHNPIKGSAGNYYAKVHAGRGGTVYGKTKEEVVTKYWDRAYGNRLENNDGTSDGANYRGRGYVQLTGRKNYREMSDHLNSIGFTYTLNGVKYGGDGTPIDLLTNYTHVNLSKELAAAAMVEGSKLGMFTTRNLDRYINEDKTDYTNARRVINGTDQASHIAAIARRYEGAITGLWAPVFVPDPNAKSEEGGQGSEPAPATADAEAVVTPGAAAEVEKEGQGQEPTGTEVKPEDEASNEPTVSIPKDIEAPAQDVETDTGSANSGSTPTTDEPATATAAVDGEAAMVTSGTLNVRAQRNTNQPPLGALSSGDYVLITERDGDWGKIEFQGQEAWIHTGYVTLASAEGGASMANRQTQTAYREWLANQVAQVTRLEGQDQFDRASGLLWQAELHAHQLRHGENIDIQTLNTNPSVGEGVSSGAVPPEWIAPLRALIELVENSDIEGGESDWNSRLGVPQYRTQSDNLVSPETTCATTSLAMVVERLGLSRDQLVAGIDRRLNVADAEPTQRQQVWVSRATPFLAANDSGSNYRRLRGRATSASERGVYAANLREEGQMEDLLAFLAYTMDISRFSITSNEANLTRMLSAIDSDTGSNTKTEQLWNANNWASFTGKVANCVNNGGSAIFSLYHKGHRTSGKTHITVVQRVESDGLILDDPYGRMRADYRARSGNGDAYANRGSTSRVSNNTKDTAGDSYQASEARDLSANESRGDSYKVPRELVQSAMYYVMLAKKQD